LVGIASYGDVRSPGGATFALFDVPTAAEFLGKPGFVDAILVVSDGSRSDEALATDIDAIFDPSQKVETLTGAEITKETQDEIGQFLAFFGQFLFIFSVIALFVGGFVIYNVFSISAAQRQRENALLRALGANRAQITRSMLIESVVVGLFGSVLGFFAGLGVSKLLSIALPAIGFDLPSGGLVITKFIFVVTVSVGLIVTVLSAVLPARRAGKVPPLAAMRASALETSGATAARLGFSLISTVFGAMFIALRFFFGSSVVFVGLGAFSLLVALILAGAIIASPVSLFIGQVLVKLRGVTGQMARQNAARNPKRTSRTSAPVLIGVALVTAVSALAASISGQIADIFTEQFKADYAVNSNAQGFGGLSADLATTLSNIDGVDDASGIGTVLTKIDGKGRSITVITPSTIGGNYDIGLVNADYSVLDKEGILISESLAERENLKVGSIIPVTFGDGVTRDLTVRALYIHNDLARDRVISRETFAGTTVSSFDFSVYVTMEKGADSEKVRAELQKAVDDYGQGKLLSLDGYIDEQAGPVNQLLALIYGLLALSVIIAIVGIIITLLLSVFERQREIGLLRAVGMTQSQVRTTVRWESVITSLLGAVLGVLFGIGLGWLIVYALRDQGLTSFEVPVATTIIIMVMSFVVGVLAAVYPAWRATKVDILNALNTN
jgi:putative ABC transport system permease protein